MEVSTWDTVFIRAPRRAIHAVVAEVAGWPAWWPGLTVSRRGRGFAATLRPPGRLTRVHRWLLTPARERPQLGVDLRYRGDLTGEAELYYLDEPAGTVVHYLFRGVVPDRRGKALVADHRAGARQALDTLKDRLETGRRPGDEPPADLLAEQRRAMAEFAEGVAASQRRSAAVTPPKES